MNPITEAGPAHAAALAAMHKLAFAHEPWNEAAFATLLRQPGVLALTHDASGFILLRAVLDEAEILTLGVLAKRQGIGAALLREGLRRLGAGGIGAVYLEVARGNDPARALYEKFGFVQCGLRNAYYEDGDDAVLLRLDLGAQAVHQS